jgi:tRNA-intron endonuclease
VDKILARVEALADGRLIVWSPADGNRLFSEGFYGKPLGIPKPRDDFEVPLILGPIESIYLKERGLIEVFSGKESRKVTFEELKEKARETLEGLDMKYLVYKDLREKGFVVAPGIKYGCDFAVYEHGPGIDHAPFIVKVKHLGDSITAEEIVEAGRLATTVRKTFIIALINGSEIKYLSFKWWKP